MNEDIRTRIQTLADQEFSYVVFDRIACLLDHVDLSNIKSIVDVGAAHGYESYNLARLFSDAQVTGFEPTPEHWDYLRTHLIRMPVDVRSRIQFENLALNYKNELIEFHILDRENAASNNSGIASKYKLFDSHVFGHENNVQKTIQVESVTMDSYFENKTPPDLIWMDAQGSELDILRGAENCLKSVKAILTEVGLVAYYDGQSLKPEIDAYLESQGFRELKSAYVQRHQFEADTIYIRVD